MMSRIFLRKTLVAVFILSLYLLNVLGSVAHADAPKPKYGPQGHPYATTLSQDPSYFQSAKHKAAVFWSLIGYYVPQPEESSYCSVASVSMVLNAARTFLPKTTEDKHITQNALLEKVTTEHWKKRVSKEGFEGAHGTTLEQLAHVTEASFKAFGFAEVAVSAVHANTDTDKKKLLAVLKKLESTPANKLFVIANFNQQSYTDDADAGHIAPVGAYDSVKNRVLVLDPDREWCEPYWVGFEQFWKGLATTDSVSKQTRGFVVVELK